MYKDLCVDFIVKTKWRKQKLVLVEAHQSKKTNGASSKWTLSSAHRSSNNDLGKRLLTTLPLPLLIPFSSPLDPFICKHVGVLVVH